MTNLLASQQPAPIPEYDEHSCSNCDEFVHVPEGLEFSRSLGDICNSCKDERIARLEAALRTLERVVVELYPGHAEPDGEHLGEYRAVWTAVHDARAALSTPLRTPGRDKP